MAKVMGVIAALVIGGSSARQKKMTVANAPTLTTAPVLQRPSNNLQRCFYVSVSVRACRVLICTRARVFVRC